MAFKQRSSPLDLMAGTSNKKNKKQPNKPTFFGAVVEGVKEMGKHLIPGYSQYKMMEYFKNKKDIEKFQTGGSGPMDTASEKMYERLKK
jgi:hypothetical protein|tara:strand:+ start:179 stop:445 length:267 start_codon:yes stop_codon:yes gene_type:complete